MRTITQMRKIMKVGTLWEITELGVTTYWRVTKNCTYSVWFENAAKKKRKLTWPPLYRTHFLPDGSGFTVRTRHNTTYKEVTS